MTKTFTGIAATLACLVSTVTPAAADWRADFGTYNIGILSGENEADRLRRYSCLQELMTDTLGVPVELYPAADYAGVMQGLLAGQLHHAGLGASGYAGIYLQDPEAVDVVMTSANVDGSLGYYSVIVTRADSGIETLEDMAGRSLAYADANSASGYLFPRAELRLAGIEDAYFGRVGFSGGHEQGVIAVLQGQYDAAATWSSLLGEHAEGYSRGNIRRMVDNGLLDMNDIKIIWTSDLIPNGPTVLRKDLPQEARALVMDLFLNMKERQPDCYNATIGGEGGGFVEIGHDFYETAVRLREDEIASSR
ncbi:phosphonate transport system substrate-binding protein [Roseinatronobacter thiooxidans]|uniref:Phosphonate transport system substrate-binding protein n=1 Tax=Roseinatronobacter thiooxidans TaxID=121821 RepID=A0A2W7PW19_9RHOB|nr:phosphate/phosphite/phosphonate ABC transporter substrate-binding protein [Roseinatronobacter thiooxidans]PZX38000.1 phosphonate transport system substrate-binding protein [Roseinatronobacter thiooxidans]